MYFWAERSSALSIEQPAPPLTRLCLRAMYLMPFMGESFLIRSTMTVIPSPSWTCSLVCGHSCSHCNSAIEAPEYVGIVSSQFGYCFIRKDRTSSSWSLCLKGQKHRRHLWLKYWRRFQRGIAPSTLTSVWNSRPLLYVWGPWEFTAKSKPWLRGRNSLLSQDGPTIRSVASKTSAWASLPLFRRVLR